MFSSIQRLIGVITVQEKGDLIHIDGLPAGRLMTDIRKVWSTSKIEQFMFTKMRGSSIAFHRFFALDFEYAMNTLLEKGHRSNRRAVKQILAELRENTWLKRLNEDHPDIVNWERLDELNITILPTQRQFIETYNKIVPKYLLKGYLLGAAPGTGKTIAGLSLATVLEADVVFCVVPKNAVNKVWEDTITSIYKTPVTYWLSNDGSVPVTGRKIYVVHYEALEKIVQFVRSNRGYWKKPVVLLDESHNLNEIGSARTQNFILLCKLLDAKHVVWASGTPLKAAGTEVAPLMHTIDSFFDEDTEKRFMGVFGKNASRALDILANRMGLVTFKVDKAQAVGNKVKDYTIKVKIPNGDDYTLDAIREVMKKFIEERMRYYRENMRHYVDIYESCLAIYEKSITHDRSAQEKFKLYKSYISMIRRGYDPVTMKEMALYCNQFELGQIVQALPQHMKNDFKDCRSVVKYYDLKVQGEALGRILGKMRAQCHVDMLPHTPITELVEESEKKTVIFTSYVEVVRAAEIQLKEEGFKPILVFGETNKDLPAIVTKFRDDIDTNPLVATYKSLSTAVPLVMANTVILLNAPFRDYERQQATSRVDRLGQDCEVNIVTIMLDTGEKPNISTRSGDILDWSREQVEQIMGVKAIELGVECYAGLLGDSDIQQAVDRPSWSKW